MIKVDISRKIKTYDGNRDLVVSHSFADLSITRITGPSGSGKTTFLKLIAGLIKPDSGTITVGEKTWFDSKQKINLSPQKRRAGFVFQDYALFPNMTVMEHLTYASQNKPLIHKLLATGNMQSFVNHRPAHLSGGQQQRLAILRALATEPGVLLMDEPFSALDEELRIALIADLKQLLQEIKTTCLIVTHHPAELDGLAQFTLRI
ncbi:ATP-binding cassette domain-containing protein [Pedobacter sp. HMF7647]|uniref:ATP-binding cassette domain-containing protein n=1 Tax=Hufsiella arboris TaxID=2695275 RepID=A0A7K1YF16_9SPHI|nr:ATP-binding cassette domain-containing protein [Hufsiella arboris]MXV52638.1 ATP-binding cassette domain-containing protein [Hufsiella arboris]